MDSAGNSVSSPEAGGAKSGKDKPNISVENLRAHGIEYDLLIPDGTADRHLPQSIDDVRELLLYPIMSPIPRFYNDRKDRKDLMEIELSKARQAWNAEENNARDPWSLMPPPTAWFDAVHPSKDEEIHTENTNKEIDDCREIAQAARECQKAGEASWTHFLRDSIFRNYRSTTRPLRKHDLIYEKWCIEEDVYWTNHTTRKTKAGIQSLTGPKPDLTYGFPIFQSIDELPRGSTTQAEARSFSGATIRRLNSSPWELKASLTNKIHQENPTDLKDSDLMCFPWAVVEVKHLSGQKDFCYRQAANASATALDVTTSLFTEPDGQVNDDLPPTIAFTCIGPEFRLWLMFWREQDGRRIKMMTCVWATHLELTWGVFAARSVVNRMTQRWAMESLKQKICHQITQTLRTPYSDNRAATPDDERASPHPQSGSRVQTDDLRTSAPQPPSQLDTPSRRDPTNGKALQKEHTPRISETVNNTPPTTPGGSPEGNEPSCSSATSKESTKGAQKAHGRGNSSGLPMFTFGKSGIQPVSFGINIPNASSIDKKRQPMGFGGPVSPLSGIKSKGNTPTSDLPCHPLPVAEEDRHKSSPSSGSVVSSTQQSKKEQLSHRFLNRSEPNSIDEPRHVKPTTLPRTPESRAHQSSPHMSATKSASNDTLSPETDVQEHGSTGQSKESRSSGSPISKRFSHSIKQPYRRYHVYKMHHKTTLTWVLHQVERFRTSAQDPRRPHSLEPSSESEDSSDNRSNSAEGTESDVGSRASAVHPSGSEYVPSESSGGEEGDESEDESEDWSDEDQETDWESESEGQSHGYRDTESGVQSSYASSGDQHSEVSRNASDSGSSGFRDSEVDDSDGSEDGRSSDDIACQDDEHHDKFTDARGDDQHLRLTHGYLLQGSDIASLKTMALSSMSGAELAQLPSMRSLIEEEIDRKSMRRWCLAFWNHQRFEPGECAIRESLTRDLNACRVLEEGGDDDTPDAEQSSLDFGVMRRLCNLECILDLASKYRRLDLLRCICANLLCLTEAPNCVPILNYIGMAEDYELWSRLGVQALQYLHCKGELVL